MFILCKGDQAKKPYTIPMSEVPVYSLEELCYYIYNHIYNVTEECFNEKLVVWLSKEIGLENLAKKVQVLIRNKHDLKDLVVTLLCSCDYYKENEIKQLVKVMEQIQNLPEEMKNKRKADNHLLAGKYGRSLQEYRALLYGDMAERFSTEEYGNILHNQAVALLHVSSFREAAKGFKEAYVRNHKEESLTQYLYALLLDGQESLFEKEAVSLGKTFEEARQILEEYRRVSGNQSNVADHLDDDFLLLCKKEIRSAYSDGWCE